MLSLLMNVLAQDGVPCGIDPENWWRGPLVPILLIGVAYFVVMGHLRKKQQRKREDELGGLKKNARIMTIGGIYGTVVQVTDDNKVVVKIDETTNTRMTIARSAVRNVLTGKDAPEDKQER
jgi:preprotein translocase subunit YajC